MLYALAPEPLGKLDADVLGSLYATYVEDIDRDRLGQFFTPRDVVRFMLDRAGFAGAERVFRVEGDRRRPLRILDFATGSGGFLVEAARRIIDAVDDEPRSLREALAAIVHGFTGGEISPFPYYLTEINLLLQVSRLLGPLHTHGDHQVPSFGALGVLPVDTLTAKSSPDASLELGPELRSDHGELVADERFGLVPLDGTKRDIYRERLRADDAFDLVVGNPPYVAEANNKPLFDRLRAIPAWRSVYRGKTDYLYYFLLLAAEKLAPAGRLCVITPAGWMNAGNADFLRERLSAELTLEELFLFGSYRLFATEDAAPTPTVESAILLATKASAPRGHKLRVVAVEDEAAAPRDRHELLEEMAARATARGGRRGGIHVHSIEQATLRADRPWPVKFGARDIATLAVAHLDGLLEEGRAEPLGDHWRATMGIETGADEYTPRVRKRLEPQIRERLERDGARPGDPILQLPAGAENRSPWAGHKDVLAKAPEADAILYGAIDAANYVSYVRLGADEPPPAIIEELERWRPVLSTRAEIARNPRRKWWETAWPRSEGDLCAAKVVGVHRTDRGRFAVDEEGQWAAGKNAVILVGLRPDPPVAYLCGVLNSTLIDLWYAVRGRTPRDVWRDYEPKPMKPMPYAPPDGDPRAEEVAELVRRIAANRRALLPHRAAFHGLERTVKDPWSTGPVEPDERALLAALPPAETVSVRLDPELRVHVASDAPGRLVRAGRRSIELRRGRSAVARIEGDPGRLDLVERLAAGRGAGELLETLLPKDADAFAAHVERRAHEVERLLAECRELVERVERLVCAIYDVPDDLVERIVEHAVARAARTSG